MRPYTDTRTRVDVAVTFDGHPMEAARYTATLSADTDTEATVRAAREQASDYIRAGIAAGNDASRYGMAERTVLTVATDWEVIA